MRRKMKDSCRLNRKRVILKTDAAGTELLNKEKISSAIASTNTHTENTNDFKNFFKANAILDKICTEIEQNKPKLPHALYL